MKRVRVLERIVGVFVFIGVVCGILAICGVFKTTPTPTFDDEAPSSSSNDSAHVRPANCSDVPPTSRVVGYWSSEMAGCESIPAGVTHVVLFSATVSADGSVSSSLQSSDAVTNACLANLHRRCVHVLAGLHSANSTELINSAPSTLVAGVSDLLDKFDFDGIAVHDESDQSTNYTTSAALTYMTALSELLRPANLSLAYDALLYEADPDKCAETKCFPAGVEALVDWVGVFGFNAARDDAEAAVVYPAAIAPGGIFSKWMAALQDPAKLSIVVSSAGGASWGPDLSTAVVADFVTFAKSAGGVGVWTASNDMYTDYPVVSTVLNTLEGAVRVRTAPPTAVPAPPKATKPLSVFCRSGVSYSVKAGDSAWSIVTSICKKSSNTKCSRSGIWLYRTSSLELCPSDLGTGDKVTVCCGVN
ncbi:carbohydrate-binding protein [Achlya hypogyna]|uniref:Carbohydrate-binding protein n=1 Tax=Achlya hypogyna TaxID=1202772 RepID=A0A1V9YK06_ACHHY|nr:carbohydrate-binding protein [Achlya hypogyna]